MKRFLISVHVGGGVEFLDLSEGTYLVGSAAGADVRLQTEGIAEYHVNVEIGSERICIEDLAGGVSVNGAAISKRVEMEMPVSIELFGVKIVFEPRLAAASAPEAGKGDSLDAPTMVIAFSPEGEAGTKFPGSFESQFSGAETGAVFGVREASTTVRYELKKELAQGGMGIVYVGGDAELERELAVKVSKLGIGGDPRFALEAKVLGQLAHPNIVPIHAMGTDEDGFPFYSMKLVKGRSLQKIIEGLRDNEEEVLKAFPLGRLMEVFRKVCDAMAFAHSKAVLHRDLKPDNVMVGEFGEVLVMDWGMAKFLGEPELFPDAPAGAGGSGGDLGLTMVGEVLGTPKYMSPEQAEGDSANVDERSDVYALGAILYAILTHRTPFEAKTLDELLVKVRTGAITPIQTGRGKQAGPVGAREAATMERTIPKALQAVTLKAMSLKRENRYPSVEALAAEIERYQNGFATSAENAGALRQLSLLIRRNKMVSGLVAAMFVVVSGFTARVVQKGREANEALQSLRETAPTFAVRVQDALREGQFEEALKAASFAVKLESQNAEYHALRGDVLQVLVRWSEALAEYESAVRLGAKQKAQENLILTEDLLRRAKSEGDAKAKVALFEALNAQGRQYEAMEFAKGLGDFWKERKKDPSALPELIKQLEAKLLPVPGTEILMSKTEITVGEWKLYIKAEGLLEWQQPSRDWTQTDDHPVVNISWEKAKEFCDWLSAKSGKKWRLPKNAEWEAAVGTTTYPWGDYFPPKWDDGNYAILEDGKFDPRMVGVDGIKGTAPVGSFKPNALGFYDLGGNVGEWMLDGFDTSDSAARRVLRGDNWCGLPNGARIEYRSLHNPTHVGFNVGFRIARGGL